MPRPLLAVAALVLLLPAAIVGQEAIPRPPGVGSGDVGGPASATNEAVSVFDGTTGKLLKQLTTGNTGDVLQRQSTGAVAFRHPTRRDFAVSGLASFGLHHAGVIAADGTITTVTDDTDYDRPAAGVVVACTPGFSCTAGETATVQTSGLLEGIDTTSMIPDAGYEGYPVCVAPGSTAISFARCGQRQARPVGVVLSHAATGRLWIDPGAAGRRKVGSVASGTCEASNWSFARNDFCWEDANNVLKICEADECFGSGWVAAGGSAPSISYTPATGAHWLEEMVSSLPTTVQLGIDVIASYLANGHRVCELGTFENDLQRLQYTTLTGSLPLGTKVQGQTSGATAWLLSTYGSGSGNGLIVQAVKGTFANGEQVCQAPSTCANNVVLTAAPAQVGTYACETSFGDAADTHVTKSVWISFLRASSSDEPTGTTRAIEQAFYYCSDNNLRDSAIAGLTTVQSGCPIELEPGLYSVTETIDWRGRSDADPTHGNRLNITFDGGGAALYWTPGNPTSSTVAGLPTCNEANYGIVRRVTDPAGFDDITNTSAAALSITAVRGADNDDDPECTTTANGGECSYGKVSRVFTTASAHAFSHGLPLRNGDVVSITGAADPDCNGNVIVKSTGGSLTTSEFITNPFDDGDTNPATTGCDDVTGASVEIADTVAWCNGHAWVPTYPMWAIGGKNQSGTGISEGIRIDNVAIGFSGQTNRMSGIFLNGWYGAGNAGGLQDFDVRVRHMSGNGDEIGMVLVEAGAGDPTKQMNNGSNDFLLDNGRIEYSTDFFGDGWSHPLRLTHGSNITIVPYSKHGSSLAIGNTQQSTNPSAIVTLGGSLAGYNDGPGLWHRSGGLTMVGTIVSGDANAAASGPLGFDRALVAIVGGATVEARLNLVSAHLVATTTTVVTPCQIYVNDAAIDGIGGSLSLLGKLEAGDSKRLVFCAGGTHANISRLTITGARAVKSGSVTPTDADYYGEPLGAPTISGPVCPNCTGSAGVFSTGPSFGVKDDTAPIATGCLSNLYNANGGADSAVTQGCGSATSNPHLTILPLTGFGSGERPWIHGFTCANGGSASPPTGWQAGDTVTLAAKANNGTTQETLLSGITVADTDFPIFTKRVNRAPVATAENLGLQLEITAVNDAAGANNILNLGCWPLVSRLVPF
jgi:hypothetical protein